MRAAGAKTCDKDRALKCTKVETSLKETFKGIKRTARASINGGMVRYTTGNGKRGKKMGMESGRAFFKTAILGNGRIARLRGTGFICGKMGTSMRENG